MEHRLDASFAALSAQIVRSHHEIRDEITATLRVEMRAMAGDLRGEMKEMREDLREEMYVLHRLSGDRIDKLEASTVEGLAESRRYAVMLHEEVLSRLALLAEIRRG